MRGAGRGVEGGRDNTAQPGAQGTTHHLIMGRAVTIVQTTDCGRDYTATHTRTHTQYSELAYSGTLVNTVNIIVPIQHLTTTDSNLRWTGLLISNNRN